MTVLWMENFDDPAPSGLFMDRKYRTWEGNGLSSGIGTCHGSTFNVAGPRHHHQHGARGGNLGDYFGTKKLVDQSPLPEVWVVGFGLWVQHYSGAGSGSTYNDRVVGVTFNTNTDGSPITAQVSLLLEKINNHSFKWILVRGDQQNSTKLAESTPFWCGRWHFFELKICIHPTEGWWELRQTNQNEGTSSIIMIAGSEMYNTAADGTAGADSVAFPCDTYQKWNSTIYNIYWNDIYILIDDGTGEDCDFLGDVQIEQIYPSGDNTDAKEWLLSEGATGTDHYAQVQEQAWGPAQDDEFVYAESASPIPVDLWDYDELSYIGENIVAIQMNSTVAMHTSGSRTLRHKIGDESSPRNTQSGTKQMVLTSVEFDVEFELFSKDPVTDAALTKTLMDDRVFGVECIA